MVIGHLQALPGRPQEQPPTATNSKLNALADRQPFLFEGNWGHTHTACVLEQDLPALVDRVQASCPGSECFCTVNLSSKCSPNPSPFAFFLSYPDFLDTHATRWSLLQRADELTSRTAARSSRN